MSEPDERTGTYVHFMAHMGVALTSWASVEEAHFRVFREMMGGTKREICSVIYFGIPSFEGKRVLVDRVSNYYLADEFRRDWSKLNADLQTASSQRGMLAHYALDFELLSETEREDGSISFAFGEPRLRPSTYNEIFVIQGKTGDRHVLTAEKIAPIIDDFQLLEKRLSDFARDMKEKPPSTEITQAPLPTGGLLDGLLQFNPNNPPAASEPSGN